MWNKYLSFRLSVNSHNVCQSPVWNCFLWGIWFPCCSCTQEMTCGSDTARLLEQMLSSFWREMLYVAHLWTPVWAINLKIRALKAKRNHCLPAGMGFFSSFDTLQWCFVIRVCPLRGTCMCGGTKRLSSFWPATCFSL